MKRDYRTDEIREFITRLHREGTIGDSNSYKGISLSDEQRLTSLLIAATPSVDLPALHELDIHGGLPVMIARYVDSGSSEKAIELANYIKQLYIDHFKSTIKSLIEDKSYE